MLPRCATVRLVPLSGPWAGEPLDMPDGALLGRGGVPGVRVVVDDPGLSPAHCRLVARRGGWEVQDAGGAGGVSVNGLRVARGSLAEGDVLRMGGREYRVGAARRTWPWGGRRAP